MICLRADLRLEAGRDRIKAAASLIFAVEWRVLSLSLA